MRRATPRHLRIGVAAAILLSLLVPPSDPVKIMFVYSNDATTLLGPLIRAFDQSHDDVEVDHHEQASGAVKDAIVAGSMRPTMWMPAASTWVSLLNHEFGSTIAPPDNPSFFWSPEVIGTFLEYEGEIRGWEDVVRAATGSATLGSGPFRLGHTKPTTSTSGLYALLSEFAAVHPSGEPRVDVDSIEMVRNVESAVLHYGDIAEEFCPLVKRYSSGYVDAFYMQETTFLKCQGDDRLGLVAVIPSATYVADYPLVVLDAPWVSEREADAAARFVDFVDKHLDVDAVSEEQYRYGDPWDEDGVASDPAPERAARSEWTPLRVPSAEVLTTVQSAWTEVRKPARVMVVLEQSGMDVNSALQQAKSALAAFIEGLPADAHAGLTSFTSEVSVWQGTPLALNDSYRRLLLRDLAEIGPEHATTSALCEAVADGLSRLEESDDPRSIDILIVAARGVDDSAEGVCNELLATIERTSEHRSPAQIYALSFGDAQGDELLDEIATRSFGRCADFFFEEDADDLCEARASSLLDDLDGIV